MLASNLQYHQRSQLRHFCGPISTVRTLKEAYENAVHRLASANIPEPEDSARYLLCDVVGVGYRLVTSVLQFYKRFIRSIFSCIRS